MAWPHYILYGWKSFREEIPPWCSDVRCLGGLRRFGFAGGLGPSTVLPQLEAMHRDCEASYKDAVVWIDMESRIRSQARDPQKPGKNVEILEGKSDRIFFQWLSQEVGWRCQKAE